MVYRCYVFCLHSKNLSKLCFFRLMQLSLSGLNSITDLTQASASLLPGLSDVGLSGLSIILKLTKCYLKPERLTLDSPGSSEAEAWVKSTRLLSPARAAHLLS